jgi:lysine 2,3-aminomutase
LDGSKGLPLDEDPLWRQVRFYTAIPTGTDYDGMHENWELPKELPTPILHHKYPDRALFRVIATCFAYCSYCYMARRTLDKNHAASGAEFKMHWADSLRYLRDNPQIQDVLISGGEPLMLDDDQLDSLLKDLRGIPTVKTLRLNTRALSFNPSRITPGLCKVLARHKLTALEVQVAHPRELGPELDQALEKLHKAHSSLVILNRTPLLRGVNDSLAVMRELCLALYARGVLPYYVFHAAPYSPHRAQFGVPLRKGAALFNALRRTLPGPAMPRYTLFHPSGKQDIPLEPKGTPHFRYLNNGMVRFKNWRGQWCQYQDAHL